MSLRIRTREINTASVFDLQRKQKYECLPMTGVVPASSNSAVKVSVSNQGHFQCLFVTGSFTTLYTPAAIADDGVSHLRGKLFSNNDPIFNSYVPFDLFLTPGRRKSAADLTGAAGNSLFMPFQLEFLFPANSDIIMDTINDGTAVNSFDIAFWGIRCNAYEAVSRAMPGAPRQRRRG